MRLCDEYAERMGLNPLLLRHSTNLFLFFNSGKLLLSVKWVNSSGSGFYEFLECSLGSFVKVISKKTVKWSSYEGELESWLKHHGNFVFGRDEVFCLVWDFFVKRNDLFLAKNLSPVLVCRSLGDPQLAMSIAAEEPCRTLFWEGKSGLILKNYANWLEMWH